MYKQIEYSGQGDLLFYGQDLMKVLRRRDRPLYLYSRRALRERVELFLQCSQVLSPRKTQAYYAGKANSHPEILKLMKSKSLGLDAVSAGELRLGLKAGFRPDKMIFSGVGKTHEEIEFALKTGIQQLNVESLPELVRIADLAKKLRRKGPIAFRINPAVNPKTHPYIATGFRENKFGIDLTQLPEALSLLGSRQEDLEFKGLSLHIGSQIFDFTSISEAVDHALQVCKEFAVAGFPVKRLDVGGGVGVDYSQSSEKSDTKNLKNYFALLKKALHGFSGEICFEPGRFLVARTGILLGQVQYLKKTPYKKFVVLNTGMHHLLRPALYQAQHRMVPVLKRAGRSDTWDVVGPVCESSDVIGFSRKLSPLQELDWLAILDAGAYGASMASDYNSFGLPDEILI